MTSRTFSSTKRTSHDSGRYAAMVSRPCGGMNAFTRGRTGTRGGRYRRRARSAARCRGSVAGLGLVARAHGGSGSRAGESRVLGAGQAPAVTAAGPLDVERGDASQLAAVPGVVEGPRAVHGGAVVPDHEVADAPRCRYTNRAASRAR